ncbi:hypothetical protein DICPUDRAFT_74619 [Dictyostelium purpureum]|uniref:Uncharacterized protein n=1 Tax=Dictyostelium purpureum TaxID=5786 RepID=F0Z899_DICPU|nr:uncharacterized protein DICPUDRAFT_74619 [Dictyostelium purpureum]EGC39857.1 hypothetical protein DICPUDRAFT_74619 [Dictyostelium purpureum]|eukprot:XP_003283608.1 hypothetical protein DICPUDRAFT_74619 [Dictyostelium purpureum]
MKLIFFILFLILYAKNAYCQIYRQFSINGCTEEKIVYLDECAPFRSCNARMQVLYSSAEDEYRLYVYYHTDETCSGEVIESCQINCNSSKPFTQGYVMVQCQESTLPIEYSSFIVESGPSCLEEIELNSCKSNCLGNVKISRNETIYEGYYLSVYDNDKCENDPTSKENFKCLPDRDVDLTGAAIACKYSSNYGYIFPIDKSNYFWKFKIK